MGVAYPLDTLKTKLQARSAAVTDSPFAVAATIVREEGVGGFYGGCSSTMAGQAAIKGVVFLVYEWAKGVLAATVLGTSAIALILAASISGAVGSLVVTPVERVKCVMQASAGGTYASPFGCVRELVAADGIVGLLTRGLGATVLREVPAYAFYFVSYDLTRTLLLESTPLPAAVVPLLGGAVAGAMAWIPVYPVDVVKTNIQVQVGGGVDGADGSFVGTARRLWDEGGPWAFWDGLGPKLARAVVNHAVCFYVVELVRAACLGSSMCAAAL